MEVLHGNQTGSKHSRRRSDRYALAENRLLDWASRDSDVDLLPHSPLALADVLTPQGGYFDLISKAAEGVETEEAAAEKPTHDAAHQRFNLLTRHSEAELLRQCKKVLVENALIKNKGDRQLYLAAGFVSWPDPNNEERRQRAPLLLYPALMVRVTDQQRYEIRIAAEPPVVNTALVVHIRERHDSALPGYSEDLPLVDFFAQVAESLRSAPSLELEFDIALGSAALIGDGSHSTGATLPDIPEHFDATLAMSMTGSKSLDHLAAVLQLIPDFSHTQATEDSIDSELDAPSMSGVALLRRYAAKLAAEGLEHIEFRQLSTLPELIDKHAGVMIQAMSTRTIKEVLKLDGLTARELIRLSSIIELIDKAPETIDQWGHGDLCYASSTILLRRAQHQARLIEDELQALQEHFHLDRIPAKSQLLSLMSELGSDVEHEPDLIDADYFSARRQFMEFSTKKPANLTAEHRRSLSQLAKVLRFRELFVNNVEYRSALGRGYRGLRTDWPLLIQHSEYARELSDVLGSETIAAAIVNNWQDFRQHIAKELDVLQQAADATRRLLKILGKRWQIQSITGLSAHVKITSERLAAWREQYGSIDSHGEKTAAIVLSSFSGPSMDHVLVETQVDEAQNRIRQQLADGELSLEQINATLDWLSQASAHAIEHDLDIESIVERLEST